jgi:hypothetical protein
MSGRGRGFLVSLMAFLFVALVGLAIAGYALGWLTIDRQPQRTTIEIDTQKLEEAASEAQKEGAELIEKSGETLRESGEALKESVDRSPDNT